MATGRSPLWWTGAALVAVGVVALLAATLLPVIEYALSAGAAVGFDTRVSGWERSGPLLPLVAIAALVLLGAAMRGDARPAGAIAALGGALAVVVALRDGSRLGETIAAGRDFLDAVSGAGPGWYAETGGAVALLAGGAALAAVALGWRIGGGGSDADGGSAGAGPAPGSGGRERGRRSAAAGDAGAGGRGGADGRGGPDARGGADGRGTTGGAGGWAAADWAGEAWTEPDAEGGRGPEPRR